MSFPYVIDEPQRLVTVRLPAVVHGHEIGETMEAMFRDAEWKPGFSVLWDGTAIGELLFEKDDLPNFVRLQRGFAETAGRGYDIFLITRELDKDVAQMYAVMLRSDNRKVQVCRSQSEAMGVLATRRE